MGYKVIVDYYDIEKMSEEEIEINFSRKVERSLKAGWELQGGVSIHIHNGLLCMAQAVRKQIS